MDDIGNLVYILVFIIWFLYRTFGKSAKKPVKPVTADNQRRANPNQTRKQRNPESTSPPVTFEDILRELTGTSIGPPEKEPAPEPYEADYYGEPEEPEEEPAFEVLEPIPEIPTAPGPVIGSRRFKEFDLKKRRTSKSARAAFKMFRTTQGARQAFIMKEIFDRKY